MTLEEAIRHAEQIADSYKDTEPNCKCAEEHGQLAEWLKELKERRAKDEPQSNILLDAMAKAFEIETKPRTCKNRKCENYDTARDHCMFIEQCHYEPKDEPQTETSTNEGKVQLTDCAWKGDK